jgi:hypothetical protein
LRVLSDQHITKEDFDGLKSTVKKQGDDLKNVFTNMAEVKFSSALSKWISVVAISISVINLVFILHVLDAI